MNSIASAIAFEHEYLNTDWLSPEIPNVITTLGDDISSALSSLIYCKLDETAWQRFYNFCQWPDGWAGERSYAASAGSLNNIERFLAEARFSSSRRKPSLFMTDDGFLELAWESLDGSAIHITFTPDGADYHIESTNEEGSADAGELCALATRIANPNF